MIKAMRSALVGLVMAAGAGVPAAWAGSVVAPEEIAALIRELGSARYKVRERASRRLWEIGEPARSALEQAAKSKDPEVAMRAEALLRDIRAGIRPDWPRECLRLARDFERGSDSARRSALDRICGVLKGKALGFLLHRLAVADARDAAHALERLKALAKGDKAIYPDILAGIGKPTNEYQGQALALARVHTGDSIAALKVLVECKIGSSQRGQIMSAGVKDLLDLLSRHEFDKAAKVAAQFADAAPTDARFLYLQAEAAAALERDAEADDLRGKALALHADKEAPHYTAGEMLQHELGRRILAEREWKKILRMPPDKSVYDMNALMRLHSIHAECGRFDQAADFLSQGLEMIESARKRSGGSVGMIGGTPQTLRKRIEALRAKARQHPGGGSAKIKDKRPDRQVGLHVQVRVKDGKMAELRRALGEVAATLTIEIQPRGLRLLDKGPLSVRYDAAKQEIGVYLNNSRCSKPAPLRLQGKAARVAIRSLDCYYVFQIDAGGGAAKRIARFETDYKLTLRPGNKIAACRDLSVRINGKPHKWADLLAGIDLDYLPKKLDVVMKGTRPSGGAFTLKFQVAPIEPPIKPLPPPATAPAPNAAPRTSNTNHRRIIQ